MTDPFDAIHSLLKSDQSAEALKSLYDSDADRILPPYDQDLNLAWLMVADICFKQALFECAKTAFERSFLERPDDVDALLGFANACTELRHFEAAQHALGLALEENPLDDRVLYNLGNVLFDVERYEDAITLYESVIAIGSDLASQAQDNLRLAVSHMKAQ